MKIISRLREIRKAHGLSVSQLYRDTGIPRSSLGDWETGRAQPSLVNGYKLAYYFGMHIDELFVPVHDVAKSREPAEPGDVSDRSPSSCPRTENSSSLTTKAAKADGESDPVLTWQKLKSIEARSILPRQAVTKL